MVPGDTVRGYRRDGFYFPLRVMSASRAAEYRAELEIIERDTPEAGNERAVWFTHANFVLPFVDEITRLPEVLEPVEAVLGPDLLVWNCSFFIKEPRTPDFVSWHQDLTYWGLDALDEVTAWVALSPATVRSGCMRFIPGSHTRDIVAHRDTFAKENLLTRGQELAVDVDEAEAVDVVLEPGQMSLHHGHIFHASRPNRSGDRRIGIAIRYITPAMSQVGGVRSYAHLVSGEDRYGHFQLAPPPAGVMCGADLERSRRNVAILEQFVYAGAEQPGKVLR